MEMKQSLYNHIFITWLAGTEQLTKLNKMYTYKYCFMKYIQRHSIFNSNKMSKIIL